MKNVKMAFLAISLLGVLAMPALAKNVKGDGVVSFNYFDSIGTLSAGGVGKMYVEGSGGVTVNAKKVRVYDYAQDVKVQVNEECLATNDGTGWVEYSGCKYLNFQGSYFTVDVDTLGESGSISVQGTGFGVAQGSGWLIGN